MSWVSVRDIDGYQLLTLSHGVGHAIHGDGLHPSGRNGAKPRVHGEHAVGEASLQDTVEGEGVEAEWVTARALLPLMRWHREGLAGPSSRGSLWAPAPLPEEGRAWGASGMGSLFSFVSLPSDQS